MGLDDEEVGGKHKEYQANNDYVNHKQAKSLLKTIP